MPEVRNAESYITNVFDSLSVVINSATRRNKGTRKIWTKSSCHEESVDVDKLYSQIGQLKVENDF